jgi:hypothetical protein
LTLAQYPSDANRITSSRHESCERATVSGIRGTVSGGSRRSTNTLDTANDYNIFTRVFASHLQSVAES